MSRSRRRLKREFRQRVRKARPFGHPAVRRYRPWMELLEDRRVLACSVLPAGNMADYLCETTADGQTFRTGDVLPVDLAQSNYSNYQLEKFHYINANNGALVETSGTSGDNKGVWELGKSDFAFTKYGSDFATSGSFLLAPSTSNDHDAIEAAQYQRMPGFQGRYLVTYKVDDSNTGETDVIKKAVIVVAPFYSTAGDEAVRDEAVRDEAVRDQAVRDLAVSTSDTVDVLRLQQRLRYLGFPGFNGTNHDGAELINHGAVEGTRVDIDSDTQWAVGLFNGVADPSSAPKNTDTDFRDAMLTGKGLALINARNAPFWQQVPKRGGIGFANTDYPSQNKDKAGNPPIESDWGASWTIDLIKRAGRIWNESRTPIQTNDLSYKVGGDHSEHETHHVGLDFDVRNTVSNEWYEPSIAQRNLAADSVFWTYLVDRYPRAVNEGICSGLLYWKEFRVT